MNQGHNPFRQIGIIRQALEDGKRPIGFLLGAGTSCSVKLENGEALIPDVDSMTAKMEKAMAGSKNKISFDKISGQLKKKKANANIEDYLTYVRSLLEVADKIELEGLNSTCLKEIDLEIADFVHKATSVKLPTDDTPFDQLAVWIRSALREYPVEIFTLNYDLLVEQAFERRKVPYFDGFVGAHEPFFDTFAIENEVSRDRGIPQRWARVWKLHGSINWWTEKGENSVEVVRSQAGNGRVCLIHPSHLKYEQARQMPYLAMMERMKKFLALPSSVLITCGYSFRDQHINTLLVQALSGRADSVAFALMRGVLGKYESEVIPIADGVPNLNFVARDGAVIGGKKGEWGQADETPMLLYGMLKEERKVEGVSKHYWAVTLGSFDQAGRMLHDLTGGVPLTRALNK